MSSRVVDEYPKDPHEIDTESLKDLLEALQMETEQYREENGLLESYYLRVVPSEPQESVDEGSGETQDKSKRRRKRVPRGKQKDKTVVLTPEMKVSIVSREIDERRMTIERVKGNAEKELEVLKAEMEEVDSEIAEVKKDAFEFRRDVVVGGENPRTGKIVAEKVVKFMEERVKQKAMLREKFESKIGSLQSQIRRMEGQLRQREEMGDSLLLIDFDQLKIENQQSLEKIEARNRELLGLKLTTGNTVQVLTGLKERLSKISSENDWLAKEIETRNNLLERLSAELSRVMEGKKEAERLHEQLIIQKEETRAPEVMDYVEQKAHLQQLEKQLKEWGRKVEIMEGQLKIARTRLSRESKMATGSRMRGAAYDYQR